MKQRLPSRDAEIENSISMSGKHLKSRNDSFGTKIAPNSSCGLRQVFVEVLKLYTFSSFSIIFVYHRESTCTLRVAISPIAIVAFAHLTFSSRFYEYSSFSHRQITQHLCPLPMLHPHGSKVFSYVAQKVFLSIIKRICFGWASLCPPTKNRAIDDQHGLVAVYIDHIYGFG